GCLGLRRRGCSHGLGLLSLLRLLHLWFFTLFGRFRGLLLFHHLGNNGLHFLAEHPFTRGEIEDRRDQHAVEDEGNRQVYLGGILFSTFAHILILFGGSIRGRICCQIDFSNVGLLKHVHHRNDIFVFCFCRPSNHDAQIRGIRAQTDHFF